MPNPLNPLWLCILNSKYPSIPFQGFWCIHIGSKLQETAGKYNYEGWTHIYIACAGTDTQRLIDMLEAMFGDSPKIDIKDTETVQEMWAKAQKAKADVAQKQGKPSAFNKSLIITKLPLVPKYGINSDYWPELVQVREWCDKKQDKVDKLYYQCHICKHESQNRASMLTHQKVYENVSCLWCM